MLASLLHDADDQKFFPENKDYNNARLILNDMSAEFVDKVIKLISWVSASKNGDDIPNSAVNNDWMLIPRYADRLEAIGMIGIERCYIYTVKKGRPICTESTPMPQTEKEIWDCATKERFNSYTNGKESDSMVDHFYDKLLHITKFPIRNSFFDKECEKRRKPLIDFLLKVGEKGGMTNKDISVFLLSSHL